MKPETDTIRQSELIQHNSQFAQLLNLKLQALEHTMKMLQPDMYRMYESKLASLIAEDERILNVARNLEELLKQARKKQE